MDGVMMAQESAREFALLTDQEISQLRIKTGKGVMMAQESAREFALLTDQEISQLRIKTGKGHRTQNDWTFISELLQDKFVYTAVPV